MYPLQESLIERRDVFLADREIQEKKNPLGGQAELCGLSLENGYLLGIFEPAEKNLQKK